MKTNLVDIMKADNSFATRYFVHKYQVLPNTTNFKQKFDVDKFLKLFRQEFENEIEEEFVDHDVYEDKTNFSIDFVLKAGVILMLSSAGRGVRIDYISDCYSIRCKLIELLIFCKVEKIDEAYFFMVASTNELHLTRMTLLNNNNGLDINDLYNDDLFENENKIDEFIQKDQKGLVLLHGNPGTGKTTYIKYLINKYKGTKFIYLPNNLFSIFDGPAFIEFFADNEGSIIIIEDAEALLLARENGNNNSISTLLNLGDGLLGDALKIRVLCTFNTDLKNIDSALLRKGRLKFIYEFKALDIEKSNKLFEKKGVNYRTTEPMVLTNVLNFEEENGHEGKIERKKIGF